MGKKILNEAQMVGVVPFQGADPIPTEESSPLTSIQVELKPGADPILVGKIPDGATQIIVSDEAHNDIRVLRVVTAEKTLYLSSINTVFSALVAGDFRGFLFVTDNGDNTQYNLVYFRIHNQGTLVIAESFTPPLEIPAGWKVKVRSEAANCYTSGCIHGYEI